MRRRLFVIGAVSLLCLTLMMGRLGVLMLQSRTEGPEHMVRWQDSTRVKAELEHFDLLQTDDARGRILFRNGAPWSGTWNRQPVHGYGALRVHSEQGYTTANPIVGMVGLPDKWPQNYKSVPEQGRSGLEYTFDNILQGRRPGYIARLQAPNHRPIGTYNYKMTPIAGADIRTTIDAAWQSIAETALQNAHVKNGAVVVLDVTKNEALAIAGVADHNALAIPAVHAETPGSIAKLVTATAALESYRFGSTSRFRCTGQVHSPGVNMRCWSVHGVLTLVEAIAESCDVAFSELGMEVGRSGFEEAARRLHLADAQLQEVDGAPVLRGAEGGAMFRRRGQDNGLLANTAIGQEDVRLTPLQAANIARTIASEGKMRPVRLVMDAERQATEQRVYDTPDDTYAMSPLTAHWLAEGMRAAVTSPRGTAHSLAVANVPVAVKTGTAELNPRTTVNAWMIGFTQLEHPRIAFSVYVGDVPSGKGHQATREITLRLLTAYRQFHAHPIIG